MEAIDWTKVKSGDRFTAEILKKKCSGKVHILHEEIFLCQNKWNGGVSPKLYGYKFSWNIFEGAPKDLKEWGVKNLKIISQSKSKPMKKKPAKENVKAIFKTANNGRWVVTENKGKNSKNKRFSVSLQSPNGNELAPDKGFNTMVAVMKHIHAVATTCQLIPLKAAKGGSVKSLSMNAYLTIKTV